MYRENLSARDIEGQPERNKDVEIKEQNEGLYGIEKSTDLEFALI